MYNRIEMIRHNIQLQPNENHPIMITVNEIGDCYWGIITDYRSTINPTTSEPLDEYVTIRLDRKKI